MKTSLWRLVSPILVAGFLLVLMASCASPTSTTTSTTTSPLSSTELAAIQADFMNSYYANASGADAALPAGARTTITVGSTRTGGEISSAPYPQGVAFSTVVGSTTSLANYPEQGLKTDFVVTLENAANAVYKVTATTTYKSTDTRNTYTEGYYVKDVTIGDPTTSDGKWTSDDPVGTWDGTTWTTNQAARISMALTFKNGSTREETILDNTSKFAPTSASDTMSFAASSVPATLASTDAAYSTVTYASLVGYVTKPSTSANFWFWGSSSTAATVVGLRYYTEVGTTTSSVSFERTVLGNVTLSGKSADDLKAIIFNGSLGTTTYTTLTKTVLRESASSKKMQIIVSDLINFIEYLLQQIDSNYVEYVKTIRN